MFAYSDVQYIISQDSGGGAWHPLQPHTALLLFPGQLQLLARSPVCLALLHNLLEHVHAYHFTALASPSPSLLIGCSLCRGWGDTYFTICWTDL